MSAADLAVIWESRLAAEGMHADLASGDKHIDVDESPGTDLDDDASSDKTPRSEKVPGFDKPGTPAPHSDEFGYERPMAINGDFSAVDVITQIRNFYSSVEDDLVASEDAAAITPAVQAQLDRAAKAKAKADADRRQRQRMAVLAACSNPQQKLVFELLCGGATAEEAAAAAGYASASVVTKMINRWKVRAAKGRIAVGFEQLDLFGGAV